jgi:hypothetical protein
MSQPQVADVCAEVYLGPVERDQIESSLVRLLLIMAYDRVSPS